MLVIKLDRRAYGQAALARDPPTLTSSLSSVLAMATPSSDLKQYPMSGKIDVPSEPWGTVEAGIRHFVACLAGPATPSLTAEHARHVLDVMLKTYDSIADGMTHDTETIFEVS